MFFLIGSAILFLLLVISFFVAWTSDNETEELEYYPWEHGQYRKLDASCKCSAQKKVEEDEIFHTDSSNCILHSMYKNTE
jgi:hypothetical protein